MQVGLVCLVLLLACESARPRPSQPARAAPRPAALLTHVYASSTPPGASVSLEGRVLGTTPLEADVPRASGPPRALVFELTLAGYRSATLHAMPTDGSVSIMAALSPERAEPAPTAVESHECIGNWAGRMRQSDGQFAQGTASIESTTGDCGSFTEHWESGTRCNYRLSECALEDDGTVRARARASSCPPVRIRLACADNRLQLFEDDGSVTVRSAMGRHRSLVPAALADALSSGP